MTRQAMYAAMRARSRECAPRLPGLVTLFHLPPPLRDLPFVQRWVGGIGTRLIAGRAELTLPNGDILCCGPTRRERHVALKTYLHVGYLGQYLRRHVPQPGDVVLDLGANLGCFMLPVARLVGETGHVYCVECVPNNAADLRRTVAANQLDNVTVIEQAAGATQGTTRMSLHQKSSQHSAFYDSGGETAEVSTTTVDDLVAAQGLTRVDFIKIDVEGMEADVLRGAARTLRQHRPYVCMAGYHRPEDATELPRVLCEIEPAYHCEGDYPAWAEFDFHAWCEEPAAAGSEAPGQ